MAYLSMGQATNDAMRVVMRADPSVIVLGEDIRWGGSFGQFRGLYDEFGERVIDMPISESIIVAVSVGAATRGLRPVASMSFVEFSMGAMDELVNQAAKLRYMFGGQTKVPFVLRCADGTIRSAAAQHSESLEALFAHVPGLKVVAPVRRLRRQGPSHRGDRRRQSGHLPREQEAAADQGGSARGPLRGAARQGGHPPRGHRRHDRRLLDPGGERARGSRGAGQGRDQRRGHRPPHPRAARHRDGDGVGRGRPVAPSSATRPGRSAASAPRSPRSCRRTLFDVLEAPGAPRRRRATPTFPSRRCSSGRSCRRTEEIARSRASSRAPRAAERTEGVVKHPVIVPNLGLVESVTLTAWTRAAGDRVAKGEAVATIETEKSEVEIESPAAGILRSWSRPVRSWSRPTHRSAFVEDDGA